jgi:glyoxylase-like metal-dependent hydrolase (beta-lactamase superfamily II)/ferredoxin
MALFSQRLPQNIEGEFFVDNSCIDCDLCRQIAPEVFHDIGDQSAVYHQPEGSDQVFSALKALVTCPTASIGTVHRQSTKDAVHAYPDKVDENVYFCGFAAESSYGASSYFIQRPTGNVLIDSPRFAMPLVKKIEEMGGVSLIFLSHQDDVADVDQWANHFRASRIMHKDDSRRVHVEQQITGIEPVQIASDLLVIPTPGHTRGHMVLLYQNQFLFSGDHVWWSENFNGLHASRSVCWYSWPEQTRSMERLLSYEFEWVLPGHGRRAHGSKAQMHQWLEDCVRRMRS